PGALRALNPVREHDRSLDRYGESSRRREGPFEAASLLQFRLSSFCGETSPSRRLSLKAVRAPRSGGSPTGLRTLPLLVGSRWPAKSRCTPLRSPSQRIKASGSPWGRHRNWKANTRADLRERDLHFEPVK